ncbi:hypothetical protein [Pseudanabaena yagii]|uniref:Uncharacterized protein n=1 Tax=Pseudanabaena yagii GIHE-NHR1 TaxID=2722753 RepID=A0ABX1LXH8_9CYAN|nr:hypothetical protein [Pseudanabaena yagii]NMF60186.1 hypothetical protein [Pseudanabaena yagii GIHE-NHR1]
MKNPLILLIVMAMISVFCTDREAIAQASDVPNPDKNGDFNTAFQQGNRGFYAIDKWLVVQPIETGSDGYGLTCRYSPNEQIRSRILRGAIVTAVFKKGSLNENKLDLPNRANDAIVLDSNNLPWLKIRGMRDELAEPSQPVLLDQLGECYVRANLKYIAPINPDSFTSHEKYYDFKSLSFIPQFWQWLTLNYRDQMNSYKDFAVK